MSVTLVARSSPAAGVKELSPKHDYWTFDFPDHDETSRLFAEHRMVLEFNDGTVRVTGSKPDWWALVKTINAIDRPAAPRFVAVFVSAFPALFAGLPRKMNPSGTLEV